MPKTTTRRTPKRVTTEIPMEDLTGTQPVHQRLTKEEEDELHNVLESSKDYLHEDILKDTFTPPEPKSKTPPKSTGKQQTGAQVEINITKMLAQIVAIGLVAATKKMFGIENQMVLEEAQSVTEPTIRMVGRRVDKYMKVVVPLDKLDKEDAKDVELIITTFTIYVFRLFIQLYQKLMIDKVKKDFEKRGETPPRIFNTQSEAEEFIRARKQQEDAHARHETMTEEKRQAIQLAMLNQQVAEESASLEPEPQPIVLNGRSHKAPVIFEPDGEDGFEYKGDSPLDYL